MCHSQECGRKCSNSNYKFRQRCELGLLFAWTRQFNVESFLNFDNDLQIFEQTETKAQYVAFHITTSQMLPTSKATPGTQISHTKQLLTYLSIRNGFAILILVNYGRLLVDSLRELRLRQLFGGASLLNGLS